MSIEDIRYPIGQYSPPANTLSSTRTDQILALGALPQQLQAAISGLTDHQLDTPYRADGWSVRQVVHHLADSHANAYIRFKLALTEHNPTIKPYDEAAWANLPDSRLPIDSSLDMVTAVHTRWVALLEALTEEDFHKGYHHPANGHSTLAQALALYVWHGRHHTAHITHLRSQKGW